MKQEKAMVEGKVGKKSLHDAQTSVCFQGDRFSERIHPINNKDLKRDSLKIIQPTYLLEILFVLP